jgi:DNA-binding transcriptional MerR regulator
MSSNARPARPASRNSPRPRTPARAGGDGEQLLKIGEAARQLGVEAYVLRFWETQFSFLRPRHSRSKHRFYGQQDLRVLRMIKRLLHEERFTIEGAKKYIREIGLDQALDSKTGPAPSPAESRSPEAAAGISASARRALAEVRRELESLHKLLES